MRPSRPAPRERDRRSKAAPAEADLHIHSTHSDGACSPCEVVIAAAQAGLGALAITDHDTLSAIEIARPEAQRWGIELISGVELSAEYGGREIHILGYFVDPDAQALRAATDRLRDSRLSRLSLMGDRLSALGFTVDLEAIRRRHPRAVLGRRHLAEHLARTGQISSAREAFVRFLGDSGPAVEPKLLLPWNQAISLIRGAGGVASLAHPPYNLRLESLETLVEGGLQAIEVDGPGISRSLSRRWREWGAQLGLVPTAGTDFHSPGQGGRGRWIGAITTSMENMERLRGCSKSAIEERLPAEFSPGQGVEGVE